jgi:hypothetical protein
LPSEVLRPDSRGDGTLVVSYEQARIRNQRGQIVRTMREALPVLRLSGTEQGGADERVGALNSPALPMLVFVGRETVLVRRRGSSEGRSERLLAQ